MARSLIELHELLRHDSWRDENPFSVDMQQQHDILFDLAISREDKEKSLRQWLQANQPCIFGRIAAGKEDRITFCILTKADILRGDQHVMATIQEYRQHWKHLALRGKKSAFVIVLITPEIASAEPDGIIEEMALRLCELYLTRQAIDTIFLDELFYYDESENQNVRWLVGINYFGAQGDKRWWRDHRIPGGMAFSMNSVGQLAYVHTKIQGQTELRPDWLSYWALPLAMKTIYSASKGICPGTRLLPHGTVPNDTKPCPFDRSRDEFKVIAGYSENAYAGWYHTDWTVPSDYFRRTERPAEERTDLPFTYLHDRSDQDFIHMGTGNKVAEEQVRLYDLFVDEA